MRLKLCEQGNKNILGARSKRCWEEPDNTNHYHRDFKTWKNFDLGRLFCCRYKFRRLRHYWNILMKFLSLSIFLIVT